MPRGGSTGGVNSATVADGDVVQCLVCESVMSAVPVGATEMLLCPDCGLGRVPEMATSSDYWEGTQGDLEFGNPYWTSGRAAMFERALGYFARQRGPGRIVDLGGGVGYFGELALALGWDAYSVDISEPAQREAATRIGAERSLSPSDAEALAGSCDVVTLWCVIAHTLEPRSLVDQAMNLLRPGGRLLVTTPNFVFQGAAARLLARVDRPYDLVCSDHILHYTPTAAARLLTRAGLEDVRFEYLGVAEHCSFTRRFVRSIMPLKRAWNYAGARVARAGLQPLSSELQIVALRPQSVTG